MSVPQEPGIILGDLDQGGAVGNKCPGQNLPEGIRIPG